MSKPCWKKTPAPSLHYMGVGFNRESLVAGSLFGSPANNAFLNVVDSTGTEVSQGYILAQNAPNVTLGITQADASRFAANIITLAPNSSLPGEWDYMRGCFSFPELSGSDLCGSLLLDVGINQMYLGLDHKAIPKGTSTKASDGSYYVPQNVEMMVTAGNEGSPPALSYHFFMPNFGPPPPGPPPSGAPTFGQWVPPSTTGTFFNTGITPLTLDDYMYDSQCGQVGFATQQP